MFFLKNSSFKEGKEMDLFRSLLIIIILISADLINTQRSSNGRHRTWWSSDEELQESQPSKASYSLNVGDDLVINQNLPSEKSRKYYNNNTISLNIDNPSINLTPEPLAAEVLKVDLSKSNMLLVSSSPTYKLIERKEKSSSDKNINFVQSKLSLSQPPKPCLSNLDCDLELNERCLLADNEEILYYDQLAKLQPLTSIYSQYLKKKWKLLKINENGFFKTEDDKSTPICGCSSPSFVRNQVTGHCELLRVVELKFKLKTNQLFEQEQNSKIDIHEKRKAYYHQLKLDALGQIDHIIKNSDSLVDIVHHFRFTNLAPIIVKSKYTEFNEIENEEENKIKKKRKIKRESIKARETRSSSTKLGNRMQNQFIARGLLLLFSSEYTANFDLLFNNEYCTTQSILRMRSQQKLFDQALSATNQTWPTIHFNNIRSADFWSLENQLNLNKLNKDKINNTNVVKESETLEIPSIHHRKKKKREIKANDGENYGLDVQLYEVNSDQIDICNLNSHYAAEELSNAINKYDFENHRFKTNNLTQLELEKKEKQLDYERRFFRLIYCDDRRAFCSSLPKTKAGYICVCNINLMDLSPFVELPGEYCGVKCPTNYCGAEGFCHVRNSVGYYPNPDYDLETQQRYLSTAGRMISFANGKSNDKRKNLTALNGNDESISLRNDYQSLIDSHKKNQTQLRQRYYAAIYSVQQRFAQLFESIPNLKFQSADSKPSELKKDNKIDERYKFDYSYSFSQNTPQLVTFYCSCPGWTIGSRCQFSGWMILLVLGILVVLLALIAICTISMLCAPGNKTARRESTKSSSKSTKSNLNTTSLTISESCSSKDSFDIDLNSQQYNQQQQQQHHHNQFNNPINRQRRASEFVNDEKRSSFPMQSKENDLKCNRQTVTQLPKQITQQPSNTQPILNIIHATPPHKSTVTQKIQFTDTITEIPYDFKIDKYVDEKDEELQNSKMEHELSTISKQVQQRMPIIGSNTANYNNDYNNYSIQNQVRRLTRPLIGKELDHLMKNNYEDNDEVNERRFELYNANDNYYNTIDDLNDDTVSAGTGNTISRKENTTQTPITHVHNIYTSNGEVRIESEEPNYVPVIRRSVGSQTSGFQSGETSLNNYLSEDLGAEKAKREDIKQKENSQRVATFLV